MFIKGVRHTGLVVRNLERSLKFYELLGLKIYKREIEKGEYIDALVGIKDVEVEWAKLDHPLGGTIELLEYKSHPDSEAINSPQPIPSNKITSGHVALTVDNLEEIYQILLEEKYDCNSPPLVNPRGNVKILYCHDPDGIIIELIEEIN